MNQYIKHAKAPHPLKWQQGHLTWPVFLMIHMNFQWVYSYTGNLPTWRRCTGRAFFQYLTMIVPLLLVKRDKNQNKVYLVISFCKVKAGARNREAYALKRAQKRFGFSGKQYLVAAGNLDAATNMKPELVLWVGLFPAVPKAVFFKARWCQWISELSLSAISH